jgi:hypothetical protein
VALICERLHVLPNEGGVLQQDEQDIKRLLVIYSHLDEWREQEMEKVSKQ